METGGSLPHSQEPATCPYPELAHVLTTPLCKNAWCYEILFPLCPFKKISYWHIIRKSVEKLNSYDLIQHKISGKPPLAYLEDIKL
jgi:hypothetical protein